MLDDYPALQRVELGPDLIQRWRYRGSTPSPEQWAQTLWNTVLAQFLVVSADSEEPLGIVVLYRPAFQHGWAYVAAARFDGGGPSYQFMLGVVLFIEYSFRHWDLRKMYMELPEYNLEQFVSGNERFFEIEGRLVGHTFYDGQHWDELVLAIYRDTFAQVREPLLRAAGVADVE
jgi:hypothetical protein